MVLMVNRNKISLNTFKIRIVSFHKLVFTKKIVSDCGDNSDELNCSQNKCKDDEFLCGERRCIPKQWVCDKENDCEDGQDERVSIKSYIQPN